MKIVDVKTAFGESVVGIKSEVNGATVIAKLDAHSPRTMGKYDLLNDCIDLELSL
jgi:hypothetical protein